MRRAGVLVTSVSLAALTLPVAAASADGEGTTALGGFAAKAIATPVRVEIHESLIPIPATPQAELDVAYTKAIATSGPAGKGRASWLWPGDPLGEGAKTFGEQLQLPPQLFENGYPVQVNSEYPSDTTNATDEPFPGVVMRTSADAETTIAKAGWSSTGDVAGAEGGDGGGDGGADGGGDEGGLPGPGDLPLPVPGVRAAAEEEPAPTPLGPLAMVVSAGGMSSVSTTSYGTDSIVASAVTRIGDLELLGGVITAESVRVLSRTTSGLTSSKSVNDVTVKGLAIGGVPFGIRGDGVVVAGQQQDVPGMDENVAGALAELGISFTLPTATRSGQGGSGSQAVRGLQVEIDFAKLRSRFDSGPVDGVIAQLPDDLGQLKSVLGAPTQARPRIVVVLGDVLTEASTVAPVDLDVPTTDPTEGGNEPTAGGGGPTSAGTVGGPAASAPTDLPPADASGDISGPVPTTGGGDLAPASAGLPPLGSVPGVLLVLGLAVAAALGWWMQRVGGLVLGGGAACSHGLASGVPDLRKA